MTAAGPTDMPTADRTQAVTDTVRCTPPGPRDPEAHSQARTTGDTGAMPTPQASPRPGNPTENAGAKPQETAEGDSRESPDSRRAEHPAVMTAEEIDKYDRDVTHYETDDETPGTGRPDMDEETPRDPQQPTTGAHAGEPAGNTDPPLPTTMGESAHRSPPLQAQAPTSGHRPRPPREQRAPQGAPPAHRPPASRRRRHAPSGQPRAADTQRLEDKGPRTQPSIPRLWCMRKGQRATLATLTHRNPRPRKNVHIPVLPRARHGKGCTVVHCPEPRRRRTSRRRSSTRLHRRQDRDRKRKSTSATMSPSLPSWHPAGTGCPPQDPQPHPHRGTRRHTGISLVLHATLPPRPTRHIFATTMPPWGRWPPST